MQHLACIMDGNRRFAKKHGWKPWVGHKKGVDAVRQAIEFCIHNKIKYLSLYTFSIENFKRSDQEKNFLFSLLVKEAQLNVQEFIQKGIQVRFIGDRAFFPQDVLSACLKVEQATQAGAILQLNFLFCYGGQQEIVHATKQLCRDVQNGQLAVDDINEKTVSNALWLGDIPTPDLIFRTGGVHRLSNFLLFQSAYAEFYFSDRLWPEITTKELQVAFDVFNQRIRNFGS
ncbi:MAG: polyprenyl diphosphate synthase [Candidatus Dependentiae bacterium]